MANLFDILSLKRNKSVEESPGHSGPKDGGGHTDIRGARGSSSDDHDHRDGRKRRSTDQASEIIQIEQDEDVDQTPEAAQTEADKIYELDSLKQFTIPRRKRPKKGMSA